MAHRGAWMSTGFLNPLLILAACGGSSSSGADAGPGGPSAQQLLAAIATCPDSVAGPFAKDNGGTPTIDICRKNTALYWTADMDIDCDGKRSDQCNPNTDPSYMGQTSIEDSKGNPLDAASLPFVVLPRITAAFDFSDFNISTGTVAAVIYKDKVAYGIFGDSGPGDIIGEASYAMAVELGINPNPANGGTDSGVSYIVFSGAQSKVSPVEDHSQAIAVGIARAKEFLGQ
jgi:hypothetical protein